jgi:hypothetical protein
MIKKIKIALPILERMLDFRKIYRIIKKIPKKFSKILRMDRKA